MKKILFIVAFAAIFCSCDNTDSVYNYRTGVVVNKMATGTNRILILRINKDRRYKIVTLHVQLGEYAQFNMGDTIK